MLRTAQSLPQEWAFDTGLRPRPFPDEAASLLPGPLAATRTGLTPASDDELTTQDQPPTRSTSCLMGARKELSDGYLPGTGYEVTTPRPVSAHEPLQRPNDRSTFKTRSQSARYSTASTASPQTGPPSAGHVAARAAQRAASPRSCTAYLRASAARVRRWPARRDPLAAMRSNVSARSVSVSAVSRPAREPTTATAVLRGVRG
jgi:hypothetical protein